MQKSSYYSRGKKQFSAGQRPRNSYPRQTRNLSGGPRKKYINPAKFVNHDVVDIEEVTYTPQYKFTDFGLSENIIKSITASGYSSPSAIQDQSIPLVMDGRDVVGLANTGTGKTAAFLLPIIHKLNIDRKFNSVLIMAPTRELAQQIDAEFKRFTSGMKLYSALLVGGANIARQIRDLQRRPHVIIGTPGRMRDLINRKQLYLYDVTTLVLDEADRMLDMGFVRDIRSIIAELPLKHQTLCFSATITVEVEKIIEDLMDHPVTVSVQVNQTNNHIYQDVVKYTSHDHKKQLLSDMLSSAELEKVIVFGDTKHGVQRLADTLTKEGISAIAIHGNKSQSQRERALKQFKDQKVKVLVATDVAARGLDIPNVSHVINYDTPQSYEDYVHRIGRTGRAGKTGKAYTFIESR